MSVVAETNAVVGTDELEIATFYIGDILMGVDIQKVQEINRHVDLTPVPHAPACVRGVINLRGDVVTVLDLRTVLDLEPAELNETSRNMIAKAGDEQVGLLVDRIADVVKVTRDEIEPPPANISGIEGRFFDGVYKMKSDLLIILNAEEVLSVDKS